MPDATRGLAEADWLLELAARCPFGVADRLGTANYLDRAARQRAVAASESGEVVSLARPPGSRSDGSRGWSPGDVSRVIPN
jgi:hypothetical protein